VSDIETAGCDHGINIQSSDTNLVPIENISYSCSADVFNLTIVPANNQNGSSNITITATDEGGLSATEVFNLTVDSVNDAPSISSIADQTISEDTTISSIEFTVSDIETAVCDHGVNIQSSDTNLVPIENISYSCSADVFSLSIAPASNQSGSSNITITATDEGGLYATEVFTLTVDSVNDVPSISSIVDQTTNEDTSIDSINFTVSDIETVGCDHGINIDSSDTSLIPIENISYSCSADVFYLTITPTSNQSGSSIITITATDEGGLSTTEVFTLTVDSVDDAPVVVQAIDDIVLESNAAEYIIPLTNVFNDIENDSIITSVYNNSNVALVIGAISGNDLILSLQPDMAGSAEFTIRATANEKSADDVFSVNVKLSDVAPEVLTPIDDIVVFEDAPSTIIDLTTVFTDANDDDLSIVKSIAYNTNESIVSTTITNNQLILSYHPDTSGTATIVIRGTSQDQSVDETFDLTVTPVDDPPIVAKAINDLTVDEDATVQTIRLYGVFTDIDNDDTHIQTIVADNSNISLVEATLSDHTLSLNYLPNQSGTAELTIMATSNGLTVTDMFMITVNPVDDPPVVANAIADVAMDISSEMLTIPLSDVFADIDNTNAEIIKTIQSNSNNALLTVQISDNNIILTHQDNAEGESTVIVQAISNGIEIYDAFTVYVDASDVAPEIQTPIENITVVEDCATTHIDLSTVFTDSDSQDQTISKMIVENTNPSLVTTSITGNNLYLIYQPDAFGSSVLTVRGTSQGKTVDNSFAVTVTPVDDPPIIENPLVDFTVNEDAPETTIDLSTVFTDPDNDYQDIVKTLINNDNESLVTGTLTGNQLILSYAPDASGTATIVIRATSDEKFVDDSFMVTVNPVDDPPVVASAVLDIITDEDAADQTIDLIDVFTDKDNENSEIQISIIENTNNTLVTSTISWNQLLLVYQSNENGIAELTIRGTSNGLHVDDTFAVIVNPVDDPPIVANAIADVALDVQTELLTIDLTNVFADIDNSDIGKTLLSNSNPELLTVTIIENSLILGHQAGLEGETEIIVQGISNGKAVEDSFNVFAYASDIAPQIAAPIEDIIVDESAGSTTIDLSTIFTDPDMNNLKRTVRNTNDSQQYITKTIVSNTNEKLITASISGDILTLVFNDGASGAGMITVRGTSRGKFVDITFTVTILSVDDPPVVANAITDITVNEDASDTLIDLTFIFTDPDNLDQNIQKSIVSNSNESLVSPVITGNLLALSYVSNASGSATLVLRGTSGGKSVETSFNVAVTPVDDPPMIATSIQPIVVNEDAPEEIIDLSGVFTDPDDYDTNIQLSNSNNTNSKLVEASISEQSIILSYLPDQHGTAIITIRGTSNGLFVEDQLNITVNGVDDKPVIANALLDITADEDAPDQIIDLTNVFTDKDNDSGDIQLSIIENTNTNLVKSTITMNQLVLNYQSNENGSSEITIRGTSNGLHVDDTFAVIVTPVDDPPIVANAISDVALDIQAESLTIDLINVFADIDSQIAKTILNNTNSEFASVSIIENNLVLSHQAGIEGETQITVQAMSNGLAIEDSFNVYAYESDIAPQIATSIEDITVVEDSSGTTIDLSSVFTDPDTDDHSITKIIVSNTNEPLVTADITGNTLTLKYQADASG
ncbi:peptidase-like protein, partial [Candidatus Magnetomorum sp. HK-1]